MPDFTRLRTQISMYSAATAVLLGVFCLLLLADVLLNREPEFGVTWTLVLAGISALVAIFFLFLGDRAGPWPALLVVTGHAVPAILYLTVLETPVTAVNVLLQMPVIALYLGGFLRPFMARMTQGLVLVVFAVTIVWDPFAVVYALNGGKSLPSMLIFTWLCLETGIFVQKRFKKETHVDELTGLYNRRGLVERADAERARADRTGAPICLVMIDLDGFKNVNDTLGHNAGDRLLRELALQWKHAARANDVLCRIGGDEFMFILPDTSLGGAHKFLARLRELSSHPWSWGLIEWQAGEALAAAITRADEEMYLRKAEKRASNEEASVSLSLPPSGVPEAATFEQPTIGVPDSRVSFSVAATTEESAPSV